MIKKNIINYNYNNTTDNIIHLGYATDNNYTRCTATSIASFCINNTSSNFHFHIITNNLSNINKLKLQILSQKFNTHITIYEINDSFFYKFPIKAHWSISMYFRYLFPSLLKNIDKIIYVDSDILCLNDSSELFNTNLENNIIAAVIEPNVPSLIERKKLLNITSPYFNSGMLVINIKLWNKYCILDKLLHIISTQSSKLLYPDQDALNILLYNNIKFIDIKFNWFNWCNNWQKNSIQNKDIILLHFGTYPKPWHLIWELNSACNKYNINIYNYYESFTPFKNSPKLAPKNYKEMEHFSKYLRKNNKYLSSTKWYIFYIINKLKNKLL